MQRDEHSSIRNSLKHRGKKPLAFDRVPLLLSFPRYLYWMPRDRKAPFTGHALKLGAAQGVATRWLHLPPL